ncbi:MAG: hypothetical protein NT130_03465 [Candidatus Micrarchaeota archaeon]|nr:hypothetical protein [Candidatus Micrarchaeota archaeon]
MSNAIDVVYLLVFIFALALVLTIVLLVLDQFATNPLVTSTFTSEQLQPIAYAQTALMYLDYLIVFVVALYFVAALVTAYYVKTHPVFYVAMLITQIIIIAISAFISNLWASIASNPVLLPITNSFVFLPLVLGYLPIITLILSSAIAVISYGNPSNPYEANQ